MSALLAMAVGVLAAGYAVWPLLRGRAAPTLSDAWEEGAEAAEVEAAALRAWAAAAGEATALDPEDFPK